MSSQTVAAEHGGHDHGHGHDNPHLQHHFTDATQQFETAKIGMWLFLATEVLLFGGLFVGYGLMQAKHPEAFKSAHHHLDWRLGALNTVVLLISSFTMVMGVHAAQTGQKAKLIRNLFLTLGCAGMFMVVKYFEYTHKIHEGLLPGRWYAFTGPHETAEFVFFSFYFMMTGLHGIHVLGGMAVLAFMLIPRALKGEYGPQYFTPIDLFGLYWHLVDMIWIYLFPLYYLIS